jgi:hypothetical protein
MRPDFLLLHPTPTPRQCLEALATAEGVNFCKPYPNIISKAAIELPGLLLLVTALTPVLVAHRVCMALDGIPIENPGDGFSLDGLLDG